MSTELKDFLERGLYHEIHVSEIREFLKCRFAHFLKYDERYYARSHSEPLELGTALHACWEVYYDPEYQTLSKERRTFMGLEEALDINDKQHSVAKQDPYYDEARAQEFVDRAKVIRTVVDNYVKNIEPQLPEMEPLAVEQHFLLPLTDYATLADGCDCINCKKKYRRITGEDMPEDLRLPFVLEGKIDLIFKYKNGKVWIHDWKHVAKFSDNYEWLDLDPQLNGYLFALWKMGYDIGGFNYFEFKKIGKDTLEPMKRRMSGKLFTTAKNKFFEYEDYLLIVSSLDEEAYKAGFYDEYLDWLKDNGPEVFKVNTIRKTDAAMIKFENDLINIITTMVTPHHNFPTATKMGCTYCEFRQVCIERQNGRDYTDLLNMTFEIKVPYYER